MGYDFGSPYPLLLLGNAVFLAALAVALGRYRDNRAAQGALGVLVGGGLWSLADALCLAATTVSEVLFWNTVSYVGVVALPPAFLLFVAGYTDRSGLVRRRYSVPVVGASLAALATAVTNPWHGLWWADEIVTPASAPPVLIEEFGVAHVLWDAYVLLVVVPVGTGMLVSHLRDETTSPLVRQQVVVVLLGIAVPILASALFVLRILRVDFTPLGFGVTGVAMAIAMTRYQLFDIGPIARDTVLENIDSGVLVVDPEDRIVDANGRATTILDTTADDLIGQGLPELVATLPDVPEYFGTVEQRQETIAVADDGDRAYYDVTVSPVELDDGTAVGRVILFSDVTEQVRRREQLEAKKLQLEEQNERLSAFAGLVSHDLRNPLQVIDANLELIDDPDHEERIEAIADATERMQDIVDQVLTLARSEGEVTETEIVVISTIAERVWSGIDHDGATLTVETTATVDADPTRLRQCFENLFRNSVEHGPDRVTVTVGDLDGGFYVEDDGPGFPEDVLSDEPSVVDYYAQEGRYGLQIVENAVEAHGWDLTITNGADGGARFEIRTE